MRPAMLGAATLAMAVHTGVATAQQPIRYSLVVAEHDLSGVTVELRISDPPQPLRLAMYAHPEYDDRYWRYIENLRAESSAGAATVVRADSGLWQVNAPLGAVTVRYRIRYPVTPGQSREAHRPSLSPTGGLIGGYHTFLYVVGAESRAATLSIDLPPGWRSATGLDAGDAPRSFVARDAATLLDSPLLVGSFESWSFASGNATHRVVYRNAPHAVPFDTTAFVSGIEKVVNAATTMFEGAPYRHYTFLIQDDALGGLEHGNSQSMGAPSAILARDPNAFLGTIAHEFFHSWNLVRIHPANFWKLDWRPATPSRGLWFSEGVTLYYADLLQRRAKIPIAGSDSTRVGHLEGLINRYLASPGNALHSAERVSETTNLASPEALGDYQASAQLQGELIGVITDMLIWAGTRGQRTLDDVMRTLLKQFGGGTGFTSADIEQAVKKVCECVTQEVFAPVTKAVAMDFDRLLRLVGLRVRITNSTVLGRDGQPAPDLRFRVWQPEGTRALRVVLSDPESAWGRAGLHTGDVVDRLNGNTFMSAADVRSWLGTLKVGETVRVDFTRATGSFTAEVVVNSYQRPVAEVLDVPGADRVTRLLKEGWKAARIGGNPIR